MNGFEPQFYVRNAGRVTHFVFAPFGCCFLREHAFKGKPKGTPFVRPYFIEGQLIYTHDYNFLTQWDDLLKHTRRLPRVALNGQNDSATFWHTHTYICIYLLSRHA